MNECMLRLCQPRVEIMQSGQFVSRCSDYIIYSVEAKNIDAVVRACGPCMRSSVIRVFLS
jgi:prephenate dehydrogenase (NADP+)